MHKNQLNMMKITLAGPSGSGKTTIANYIKSKFGVQFIPGSASLITDKESREFLEKEFDYKPEGHKAVIRKSFINPDFGIAFQRALLKSRAQVLLENDNFVTDRSPLDNLTYFMLQCSSQQSESVTREYVSRAVQAMKDGVTHLVLVRPNMGWTENNGSRVDNNIHQHMVYAVFEHLFLTFFRNECPDLKVLVLSNWDWADRKFRIDKFLIEKDEQEG